MMKFSHPQTRHIERTMPCAPKRSPCSPATGAVAKLRQQRRRRSGPHDQHFERAWQTGGPPAGGRLRVGLERHEIELAGGWVEGSGARTLLSRDVLDDGDMRGIRYGHDVQDPR